jgi:hypothetical protein
MDFGAAGAAEQEALAAVPDIVVQGAVDLDHRQSEVAEDTA